MIAILLSMNWEILSKKQKKPEEEEIKINVIAQNSEKYMAFYIGKHLAFIDSLAFLNSSLDKLASNLEEDDYIYTKKYFSDPASI